MSLMNPTMAHTQSLPRRKAASLKTTLVWYARNAWLLMEEAGRRRAAAELQRVADRLKRSGDPVADDLLDTAAELARR